MLRRRIIRPDLKDDHVFAGRGTPPLRSISETAGAHAAARSQWPSTERGSSTADCPARVRSRTRHNSRVSWSLIGSEIASP
jgi:hypothetical protein